MLPNGVGKAMQYSLRGSLIERRAAVHECAHGVAALKFGIPIGVKGITMDEYGGGFTDGKAKDVWPDGSELAKQNQLLYRVSVLVGPFAEVRYLSECNVDYSLTEILGPAVGDFLAIMGGQPRQEVTKVPMDHPGVRVGVLCFLLSEGTDTPEMRSQVASEDDFEMLRTLVTDTDKFLDEHMSAIIDMAEMLLKANRLTQEQIYVWHENQKAKAATA
jgi:hypothetical protein